MRAVLQRVSEAQVTVEGEVVGRIDAGLLALVAVCAGDGPQDVAWMAGKIAQLRLFRRGQLHFDASVGEIEGGGGAVLLVSNFTIAADARKGRRPSFDAAARPEHARPLFDELVRRVGAFGVPAATGTFGADMRVTLTNDGPATFVLDSRAGAEG